MRRLLCLSVAMLLISGLTTGAPPDQRPYPTRGELAGFLSASAGMPPGTSGDIDHDGGIDAADLVYLQAGYSLGGGARTWGGSGDDISQCIAVDGAGNILVAGFFNGTVDFDPAGEGDWHQAVGKRDAFLAKYDFGGRLDWARTWGGSEDDTSNGVAVDSSGNVVVSGRFRTTVDFDPGPGVDSHTTNHPQGLNNAYLSKFDPDGNFLWVKVWGGTGGIGGDEAYSVTVDTSGDIYVVGDFSSPSIDFDPGDAVDLHTNRSVDGFFDAFLIRFAPDGGFVWARTWGGDRYDDGPGVAVDGAGHVYVAGMFQDTVDFDPGPGVDPHSAQGHYGVAGDYATFLSKFDTDGNFLWARTWGGSGWDIGENAAVDGAGNVFITGYFEGTDDFDPGEGTDSRESKGSYDAFLSKFDSAGNRLWTRTWGDLGADKSDCIALDGRGRLFVTGVFQNTVDLDPGTGEAYRTSTGDNAAFLSAFDLDGNFTWTACWGGPGKTYSFAAAANGWGDLLAVGSFNSTTDFDPGQEVDSFPANGAFDAFLCRLRPTGSL